MAEIIGTFETGHTGPVHDTQLDYYGRRLATASSDHTIRIFDVSTDQPIFLAELKGHEGPVWQVCWAHPTFGNVLVSCSYDKKVLVWKETQRAHWEIVYSCEDFSSSINGVSWCPWDYGLQFACAIADGSIAVCSYNPETRSWTKKQVFGHPNGANSVSWAPATNSVGNSGVNPQNQPVRLVSGGCDNQIRIWKQDPQTKELTQMNQTLDIAHSEWVRDVAWRPSVDLLAETIASCGDDKIVVIWTQDADGQGWHSSQILNFNEPVWRVSWSVTGTVLAASSGEDVVTLFKENSEGKWEILTNISNNEQFTNNISCNSNIEPNSTNQTLGGNSPKNPMNNGELILSQNHQIKAQNANSQSPNKLESFGKIENISEISKNSSSEHHSISNCNFSPSQMQKPNISQQNYSSPVASQTNVIQNPINTCVSPPLQNHATNSPQPVKLNNFLNNNSNLVPSTHSNVSNKDSTNLTNPPTMHDISNASLVHNKISSILNGTSQNLNNQGSLQNQFQVASNQDFQNSLSSAPPPNKPNLSGYNSSFAVINQSSDGSTAPPKFTVPQPTMINSSGNNFGSIPPPPPPPPPGVRRYPGIQ